MFTQSCIHAVGGNFSPEQTGCEISLEDGNSPFLPSNPLTGKHLESFGAPVLLQWQSDILDLVVDCDFESKVDSAEPSLGLVGRIMQEDPSLRKWLSSLLSSITFCTNIFLTNCSPSPFFFSFNLELRVSTAPLDGSLEI
jgi:hypothetical protein